MGVMKIAGSNTVKGTKISSMKKGELFRFESAKNTANSGLYMKADSRENKAFGIENFKVLKFQTTDVGVPVDADLTIK